MFGKVGDAMNGVKWVQGERGRRVSSTPGAARRPLVFLNDIRDRAHEKWTAAGQPAGDGARFWLAAEQEIREGR